MKVEEVMSRDLIVGYVPGTIMDALKILAKHNVSGMPILKKDTKKVAGVVTRTDIFRHADEDQLALVMSSNPYVVNKDQDIKEAAKLLFEKRIHGLPVVDKKKDLVGIISPTDILKLLFDKKEEFVENYFTFNLVPIYQETPITVVMEIINITNENALPVLNDKLKLAGIVSDGDLFKLSHVRESVSRLDIGMGDDEDQWTWEGIRDTVRFYYSTTKVDLPPVPVKEIMVTDVIKAFKHTPVSEVAEKMVKNKISHIPVVDPDDRLVGMVTDIDLMACIFKSY
ncbi:MAG: CBS domain-containing protein [Thermoplasmata archaeon]|nr:MAG: CBS domain-containing protein [Thermoplasmata archaeon]RLF36795.1 MAG: CBS domain-containing protein [Thermoplasmata archaeon]